MFVARFADYCTIRTMLAGSSLPRNRHAVSGAATVRAWLPPRGIRARLFTEKNYRLLSIQPTLTLTNGSRDATPLVLLDSMRPALNATNPALTKGMPIPE